MFGWGLFPRRLFSRRRPHRHELIFRKSLVPLFLPLLGLGRFLLVVPLLVLDNSHILKELFDAALTVYSLLCLILHYVLVNLTLIRWWW